MLSVRRKGQRWGGEGYGFALPFVALFVVLACALLVLTLAWHIPMMLWDQLDIVPMYKAWHDGTLADTEFFGFRAGHVHVLAYAVLLATTYFSHGQPWLDCAASWVFLVLYATLVAAQMRRTLPAHDLLAQSIWLAMVFVTLYPGHLPNLQWGWQVAVFMSLVGTVVAIDNLARRPLSWANIAFGLLAGAFAYLSFATAVALVPTAVLLLALRDDQPRTRRIACAALWGLGGASAFVLTRGYNGTEVAATPPFFAWVHYTLNFLGGGISRFATDIAPLLALAAMGSGVWAYLRSSDRRKSLPWLGCLVFGIGCAFVVAAARVGGNGAQHAFVMRYVSFSSVFWLGWLGLIVLMDRRGPSRTQFVTVSVGIVATFAVVNAVQMMRKTARIAEETRVTEATLRATWPNVDEQLLRSLYFDQPELTRQRLDGLKALGFPPFDKPASDADKVR